MMKQVFAFENEKAFHELQEIGDRLFKRLESYKEVLKQDFALSDLPKGVVWTSDELATTVFSNLPIAAFTNKNLIYMSPDLPKWRQLFLGQLEKRDIPTAHKFYENFSENHLFIILAHELTHHIDLFPDEFDEREDSIWFEEGMCEYLPRKLLLTDKEFDEISAIEKELVGVFTGEYGNRSIDEFGSNSYTASLSSIMFDYWRSFLSVKYLVEDCFQNNVNLVFEEYHKWDKEGRKLSLTEHFGLNKISI